MNHKLVNSWVLLSLLMSTLVYSYPQPQAQSSHIAGQYSKTVQSQAEQHQPHYQYLRFQQPQPRIQHYQVHSGPQQQQQQLSQQPAEIHDAQPRKFAQKPNSVKKVDLSDVENDIESNQIDNNPGSFSWTNMLGQFMQMVIQNAQPNANLPTKSEDSDGITVGQTSPWANIISIGLRIFTTLLGGGAGGDGIDKVDNGGSPMQSIMAAVLSGVLGAKDPDQVNSMAKQANEFIAIVFNLLDALKTSFSHRSLAARSIGKKDSVSDLGIASIAMLKGYVKTTANSSEKCMQKYVCEANTECNNEIGGNSIFCQMGSYATSFVLERQTGAPFEQFYEAGRRGRQGEDCKQIYLECAESF